MDDLDLLGNTHLFRAVRYGVRTFRVQPSALSLRREHNRLSRPAFLDGRCRTLALILADCISSHKIRIITKRAHASALFFILPLYLGHGWRVRAWVPRFIADFGHGWRLRAWAPLSVMVCRQAFFLGHGCLAAAAPRLYRMFKSSSSVRICAVTR